MGERSSRHRSARTYRRELGGRTLELFEPRAFPLSAARTWHRVEGGERLDQLAHQYMADPLQYWRIADANPSSAPEDLLEPGRVLVIPETD